MPENGELVDVKWHTHHIHDREMHIFAAQPDDLDLHNPRLTVPHSASPLYLDQRDLKLHDVKVILFTALQRSRRRDSSSTLPFHLCQTHYVGLEKDRFRPGWFDRDVHLDCIPWSFSSRDHMTFVVLHDGVDPSSLAYPHDIADGRMFNHHQFYFAYLTPDDRNKSSSKFAFCGHRGSRYSSVVNSANFLNTSVFETARRRPSESFWIPEMLFASRSRGSS